MLPLISTKELIIFHCLIIAARRQSMLDEIEREFEGILTLYIYTQCLF